MNIASAGNEFPTGSIVGRAKSSELLEPPDGWHSLTAHLITKNGADTIKFYEKAFGAQVLGRHFAPDGKRCFMQRRCGR